MTKETLNQIGYIFNPNSNSIEEISYRDYLRDFGADETTSPRGVEPRIHVREGEECWELWSWGVNGNNPYKIGGYDTEEEAESEMYEHFEFYAREHNWNAPIFYYTKEDAMQQWADLSGKSYGVIERYLRIKEAADVRYAVIKKDLEEKERVFREKQNAAIEAEAGLLTPDTQFIEELKAIYANPKQYSGSEKSNALSASFVAFLNRCGHVKVQSDFWKVFRIASKKATA